MKRLAICLVLACVVGFALVGCSSSSTGAGSSASGQQKGLFKSYELVDTGTSAPMPGGVKGANGNTFEPSGKAVVTVDGKDIKATCAIENLKPGDSVTVQKDTKGNWTVTGKS